MNSDRKSKHKRRKTYHGNKLYYFLLKSKSQSNLYIPRELSVCSQQSIDKLRSLYGGELHPEFIPYLSEDNIAPLKIDRPFTTHKAKPARIFSVRYLKSAEGNYRKPSPRKSIFALSNSNSNPNLFITSFGSGKDTYAVLYIFRKETMEKTDQTIPDFEYENIYLARCKVIKK